MEDALNRLRHFSNTLLGADSRLAARFFYLLCKLYYDSPVARIALLKLCADKLSPVLQMLPPAGNAAKTQDIPLPQRIEEMCANGRLQQPFHHLVSTVTLILYPPAEYRSDGREEPRKSELASLLSQLVELLIALEPEELHLDKSAVFDASSEGKANALKRSLLLSLDLSVIYVRTAGIERIRRSPGSDPAVIVLMVGQITSMLQNLVVRSLSKRGNVETAPDGRGKVARFRREIDFGGGQRAFRAAFAAAIAATRGSFIRFDRILANERESRGAEGAGPHSGRWRDHVVCVLAASEFGRLRRIHSRRSPNSRRIPCVPARIASSASICGKRVVSPSISIFFTPCVAEFHRIHAEEPTNSLGVSLLALFPIALKCVETTSLAAYYPIPAEDGENCRLQSLLQRSERICIDLLLDNNQLSVSKLLETLDVNFETSKPDRA